MSNIFVIMNEWTTVDGSNGSEVVGATYFETQDDAWRALREIAHSHEADIDYEDTNVVFEPNAGSVEYEEYYIQELIRG